jgi:hypothetical protein
MSAVLSTQTLPAFINMEDLQAFIQSEIEKAVKPLKEEIKDLRATLNDTQELLANACLKIKVIENSIFAKNEDGDIIHEDNKPVISFESARVIVPATMEPEINEDLLIQNTTLTQKANAIYEYLKEKIKPNWAGKKVLENEGIYSFFFEIIEDKLRWPDKLRGKRTAKKSIIERAVELHPDELEIVKNKSGNKITGLALKPSLKRIDAYGR